MHFKDDYGFKRLHKAQNKLKEEKYFATKTFYLNFGGRVSFLVLKAWFIVMRTHAIKMSKPRICFHNVFLVLIIRV